MSKINPGLYSSEDMGWMTPPSLIKALLDFEDRTEFDLDAACSEFNIPSLFHYTPEGLHVEKRKAFGQWTGKDGLTGNWDLRPATLVFMNPPYGTLLKKWMQKASTESQNPGCQVWALIPARTETIYQHDHGITQAGFTVFLKGRLHFLQGGEDKGPAPFPTMLLYYGDDWQEKADRWLANPPLEGTLMITGERVRGKAE